MYQQCLETASPHMRRPLLFVRAYRLQAASCVPPSPCTIGQQPTPANGRFSTALRTGNQALHNGAEAVAAHFFPRAGRTDAPIVAIDVIRINQKIIFARRAEEKTTQCGA